ncbi:ArsB/NhaD family transporter [Bacillus stercoris]|nr:ArsB/NhaD family transporter [Bacillus stercoris]
MKLSRNIRRFNGFIVRKCVIGRLREIGTKVTGASVTILATMIMAIALESFGFFYWVAAKTAPTIHRFRHQAFLANQFALLSHDHFLNNDGSVLITTPILLLVLKYLGLKNIKKPHIY